MLHSSRYRAGGVVATGDSIYRRTVAGHSEPSETSFAEHISGHRRAASSGSPLETVILPGHGPATTVADELAANPFMRLFSGVDEPPPPRACRVGGPFGLWEAELVLIAPDYDGGRKALVRFPTIGRSIVPGQPALHRRRSALERALTARRRERPSIGAG